MGIVDFISNLAGVLLWLSWRSARFDAMARPTAMTLVGTLRKADRASPVRRWLPLAALAGLLLGRAVIYRLIGPSANWVPVIPCVAVSLPFRSDFVGQMVLFSLLSFLVTVLVLYLWLLLVSIVHHRRTEKEPILRLVRLHLGWIERWPLAVKCLSPLLAVAMAWLVLHPLLVHFAIVERSLSFWHTVEQGLVVALGSYLAWKYMMSALLLVHLVNSYVYLGHHAFWSFATLTSRRILAPLRWLPLRAGRVDFAPVVGIAGVFLLGEAAAAWLPRLFGRLPL